MQSQNKPPERLDELGLELLGLDDDGLDDPLELDGLEELEGLDELELDELELDELDDPQQHQKNANIIYSMDTPRQFLPLDHVPPNSVHWTSVIIPWDGAPGEP